MLLAVVTSPNGLSPDLVIFALTYIGLALGSIPYTHLDRSSIALLGAVAVLAFHRLSFQQAMQSVDFSTLVLLGSLMVISAQLRLAGFYAWVVCRVVSIARRPWTLLAMIVFAAAVLSALFANDVVVLIFTPVLIGALQSAKKDPVPYLMALATGSNIGSAATLIGNPQNMLIGQAGELSFWHYTVFIAPLVAGCLVLNVLAVALIYRRGIFIADNSQQLALPPEPAVVWSLVGKTLAIMAALLVAMVARPWLHISRPVAAMAAAGLVLISRKTRPRDLFALVDWNLILLFVGLFIVIADAEKHQLLKPALHALAQAGVNLQHHAPLAGATLVLSNIVSNVPAVLLLKPAIALHATSSWYLLAVVSTFAGNLTLLGSIANLIVAEQSEPLNVRLGYSEYLKVGLPLAVVTTVLAVLYMKL
ncbi:MAG: anion transporter [Phycisphaerae bacterium]